jgi:hypothetical protein
LCVFIQGSAFGSVFGSGIGTIPLSAGGATLFGGAFDAVLYGAAAFDPTLFGDVRESVLFGALETVLRGGATSRRGAFDDKPDRSSSHARKSSRSRSDIERIFAM